MPDYDRTWLDTSQPFRCSDALAAGISTADLAGPRFQRVFHGVYLRAGKRLTARERGRAALRVAPDEAYVSHHTAARIWGGVPPEEVRTHVSVPPGASRSQRRGIAGHRGLAAPDVRLRDGVRVSSPAQCFCELAASGTDLIALVVLGDSLVRAGAVSPAELAAAAENWPRNGRAIAVRAAGYVRTEVDSPMETRLRMLIVLAGLPEPTINHVIRHQNGEITMRFDLCYADLKLVIEYDGDHHITDPLQRARDMERREELEGLGWRTIVVQKEHFYRNPGRLLRRIQQARVERGASESSSRLRTTWQRYFSTR